MIPLEWTLVSMGILIWVVVCTAIWGFHWGTYYAKSDGTIRSRKFADIGGKHALIEFHLSDVQEDNRGDRVAMPLRGALIAAAIGLGLIGGVWFGLSIMTNVFPSNHSAMLILFSVLTWLIVSVISTHAFTRGANLPGSFTDLPDAPWMPFVMSTIFVSFALLVQWHYFKPDTVKSIWQGIKSVDAVGYSIPAIPFASGVLFWKYHAKYFADQCPFGTRIWYLVSISIFAIPSVILGLLIKSL